MLRKAVKNDDDERRSRTDIRSSGRLYDKRREGSDVGIESRPWMQCRD